MKTQVVVIHGGDSFRTREEYLQFLKDFPLTIDQVRPKWDWKRSLPEALGEGYDVLAPQMPNKSSAQYGEWVLWFEKILQFLEDGVILIGHSLGGTFLAKYLAEHTFPRRIGVLLLVAAPFGHSSQHVDDLGDFVIARSLDSVRMQCPVIVLFHSADDAVVPFSELAEYQREFPNARTMTFTDRGHFNQPEFPELVRCIMDSRYL